MRQKPPRLRVGVAAADSAWNRCTRLFSGYGVWTALVKVSRRSRSAKSAGGW